MAQQNNQVKQHSGKLLANL